MAERSVPPILFTSQLFRFAPLLAPPLLLLSPSTSLASGVAPSLYPRHCVANFRRDTFLSPPLFPRRTNGFRWTATV